MIVIPMLGKSQRFYNAGYQIPKWQIQLQNRPIFDWSVLSFKQYFGSEKFLFICREETSEFVIQRASTLGITDFSIVTIKSDTRGQAETVYLGIKNYESEISGDLTIFNIDTFRPNYRKAQLSDKCFGFLECFYGSGENWSFIEPYDNHSSKVRRVSEKIQISDICCTGLYRFLNFEIFSKAYHTEASNSMYSELFVAPIYQHIIDANGLVEFDIIKRNEVIFCGTPGELENILDSNLKLIDIYNM